jgi:mono/diheme cytochrome c family protein
MLKFYFIIFLLSISCSQIKPTSQHHHPENLGFRHGLVPKMNKHTMPADDEVKVKVKNLPQDSLERGQALYEGHCLACHGKNGTGNGPKAAELDKKPKDLAKLAKNVPEFKFYMMVSMLQGDMPGWETIFTSQEIIDLENYLKTL